MPDLRDTRQELSVRLPALGRRWHAGEFDAAAFAAQYFLYWQIATHGRDFASRKHRHDARPDAVEWLHVLETAKGDSLRKRLGDWLERFQFRGVVGNVPTALLQWLRGAWPLALREDVPQALEVLRMQARGMRPVTLITDWPRAGEPVLSKPDAFAFFLHDLEHGYKFCHSPALYEGQCRFFGALEAALDRGVFDPYFEDRGFVARFHYLASDMNTHPEHGRQYLRAILIEYYGRREPPDAPDGRLSDAAEQAIEEVMGAVLGGNSPCLPGTLWRAT